MGRNASLFILSTLRRASASASSSLPPLSPSNYKLLPSHPHPFVPIHHSLRGYSASAFRSFSSSSSTPSDHEPTHSNFMFTTTTTTMEHPSPHLTVEDDYFFPVSAVVSFLDSYHHLTAFPWWIVIASSTVVMRITLLPLLIKQLQKLKTISQLFPKLPPPFPPPLSGRSFLDQFLLFRKERQAIACPSFLWFLASFSVQMPCFLLLMTSIRRMSLDGHPGFDSGGILWFENLTEFPHGALGSIFPFLIGGLHYTNVQLAFGKSSVKKYTNVFDILARYYKLYLDILTLPLVFIGFCIPQGSLVYWVTNSSLSVIQQLSLNHPVVRAKLGLPEKNPLPVAANSDDTDTSNSASSESPKKLKRVPVEKLSPKELVNLSVLLLSKGHKDEVIPFLRMALEKDPDYLRALTVLGQTLLQKGQYEEAAEHLERAVSKLSLDGHPTTPEDVDLFILASQWAGVARIRQGKDAEGIIHLERVAGLKEPEEAKSKVHYFDGLLFLASALHKNGRKDEAVKYMRLVVAYNPAYTELLEQCENDDNFVSELADSRRRDY